MGRSRHIPTSADGGRTPRTEQATTSHHRGLRPPRSALLTAALAFGVAPALWATGLLRAPEGRVLFVPLSDLVAPARSASLRGLPPHQKARILDTLALPETNGCVDLVPGEIDRLVTPMRDSLEQGVRGAVGLLVGRVEEATPGFSDWDFGTLLRIEVQEVLKGASWLSQKEYLAFVPIGSGQVEGKRFCQHSRAWTTVPARDSRVLLLIAERGEVSGAWIDVLDDGGLVVVSDVRDEAQLPQRYLPGAGALAREGSASLLRAVRAWSRSAAK